MNSITAYQNTVSEGPKKLAPQVDDQRRAAFVSAMAAAPTAVTVVAFDDGEKIWGQTVSAFASVSADPPTLLVCLNQRSPLHDRLREGAEFSVNLLAPAQTAIANCFAGRSSDVLPAYGAALLEWDLSLTGVPLLRGATSAFACRVASTRAQATHGIVIGEVLETSRTEDQSHGLAYCQRDYRELR